MEEENLKSVELAEYTINNRIEDILSDIFKRKPDVIGFSCYIWNFHMVRELLYDLVKVLPNTDIWVGGPEVSFHCDRLMKELPIIKGIMVGEGEDTFRELVSCYDCAFSGNQNSADFDLQTMLEKIPGLYLPFGYTGERKLTDLDGLPFYYGAWKTLRTGSFIMNPQEAVLFDALIVFPQLTNVSDFATRRR